MRTVDEHEGADAVPLHLVCPGIAGRHLVYERCQHRPQVGRRRNPFSRPARAHAPRVLSLLGRRRLLVVGESDLDALFRSADLLLDHVAQDLTVRAGKGWLHDAARPQPANPHDVELGGEQCHLRGEEEPPQQSEHDREKPVNLARLPQLVRDEVGPADLQRGESHARKDGAGHEIVQSDLLGGERRGTRQ